MAPVAPTVIGACVERVSCPAKFVMIGASCCSERFLELSIASGSDADETAPPPPPPEPLPPPTLAQVLMATLPSSSMTRRNVAFPFLSPRYMFLSSAACARMLFV